MKFWPFTNSAETKASSAGVIISQHTVGQPVWSKRDYTAFAKEGYVMNSVAHRCIKLIAGSAASAPLVLYDKAGKEIETHPLLDLLARPNPVNGGAKLFEAFYAYLSISGNSYLEVVSIGGAPKELWVLRPDRMKVIPGAQGLPNAYEYSIGGKKIRWEVDFTSGRSEILHMRHFHPTDDWYGLSDMEAAAFGVDRFNAAAAHNKALLDNGARASGALVFEPVDTGGGVKQAAPQEVIEDAEKALMDRTGPNNAGKPFVFGGNVNWIEMGLSPRDMDFGEGKDDAARDICIAYGIPPALVVKGESTYNNISEAKLELWEQTVLPLLDQGLDELNNWLTPMFGDGLRLGIDEDGISALEPRRESKRKSTVQLLESGVIDQDEARIALQYGPRPVNSVNKVDASVLTALINGVEKMGYTPLVRYAKSIGLYPMATTEAEILAAATAHLDSMYAEMEIPDATQDEVVK